MPRKPIKKAYNARYGASNALVRLWAEDRERMLELQRINCKKGGRPPGVPNGQTRATFAPLKRKAEAKAERIIQAMSKDDVDLSDLSPDEMEIAAGLKAADLAEVLVDDEKAAARAALKEALTIGLMPGNKQTKIAALRAVLEYTKPKPASTTNTNINAAEDFLLALAKKEQ